MEKEELEQLILLESQSISIVLTPAEQGANEDEPEDLVHENFFQWTDSQWRDDGDSSLSTFLKQNPSVIFVSSIQDNGQHNLKWTNPTPIDLSGLPSLYRILVIRDITQRLRLLDEQKDEGNKMLTGQNGKTTINFKLEDIEFSLLLVPTKNQPGNAFLTMQRDAGKPYGEPHCKVEEFNCFKQLDAKKIDSIVKDARRTGKQITDGDINDSEEDEIKKKMAEEMNFFMLLYDFEVARRLQRPFVNRSHDYDSLPIGIGIAMIHDINSKNENPGWEFFSGLFQHGGELRKDFLKEIVTEFKKRNDKGGPWTKSDLIDMLRKQFGSRELFDCDADKSSMLSLLNN